jgi:hypothetical protein
VAIPVLTPVAIPVLTPVAIPVLTPVAIPVLTPVMVIPAKVAMVEVEAMTDQKSELSL